MSNSAYHLALQSAAIINGLGRQESLLDDFAMRQPEGLLPRSKMFSEVPALTGRSLFDRAMFEVLQALAILRHGVPVSEQLVLIGGQAFQAHWAAGMQLAVADADLGPQAVVIPIGKPSGGVLENACGVYLVHEFPRRL